MMKTVMLVVAGLRAQVITEILYALNQSSRVCGCDTCDYNTGWGKNL